MTVAQTATLLTILKGENQISQPAAQAEKSLAQLNATNKLVTSSTSQLSAAQKYGVNLTKNSSVALGILKASAVDAGQALNHAKGFVSGLVSGPLGLLGLGAAAFTVAGALKQGIDTANGMALSIEKLTALTGESATAMSGLLAVTGKYGVSSQQLTTIVGFEEKTVGKLSETMTKGHVPVSKLTALQKQYGVALTDSSGHALDFSQILNNASDYYTSNASAGQKAALAATVFGRGYAALIPVLQLGSKGFAEAQQAAESLGLTITAQNASDLKQYQENWRNLGDAVSGLELQLSLALIPTLNDVAKSVTAFVTDHRTDMVAFFHNTLTTVKQVAGVLVSFGQGLAHVWSMIPGPLQTLLLQALIGNKVIKTVFGIDIIGSVAGVAASLGKDLIGKLIGGLLGKTIATPLVNVDAGVVNVGGVGGAAQGLLGGAGEAAGGIGLSGLIATIAPLAVAAAVPLAINALLNSNPQQTQKEAQQGRQDTAAARGLNPTNVPLVAPKDAAGGGSTYQQWLAAQKGTTAAIDAETASQNRNAAFGRENADENAAHVRAAQIAGSSVLHAAMNNLSGLTAAQTRTVAHSLQLQTVAAHADHKLTYAQLIAQAHTAHLDHLSELGYASRQLAKAQQILTSGQSTVSKVAGLSAIQAAFSRRGDYTSAAKIGGDIIRLLFPLNAISTKIGAIQTAQETASQNRNAAFGASHKPPKVKVSATAKSTSSASIQSQRIGGP